MGTNGPKQHLPGRNFMMKHQLFSQFQNFDLDAAECSCESDREFVYAAISHLYGSKEAFTQYVRGPLQRELLEPICQNVLPRCYTELLTTPFLSLFLDFTLALWKQGAPVEDLVIYAVAWKLLFFCVWAAWKCCGSVWAVWVHSCPTSSTKTQPMIRGWPPTHLFQWGYTN